MDPKTSKQYSPVTYSKILHFFKLLVSHLLIRYNTMSLAILLVFNKYLYTLFPNWYDFLNIFTFLIHTKLSFHKTKQYKTLTYYKTLKYINK